MYIEYTLIMYVHKEQKAPLFPCVKKEKNSLWKKGLSDYPNTNSCILDEQTDKNWLLTESSIKLLNLKWNLQQKLRSNSK